MITVVQLKLTLTFVLAALAAPAPCNPEELIKIVPGSRLARSSLLVAGVQRYLRLYEKDDRKTPIDIWTRKTTFETRAGRRLVRVWQRWDGAAPDLSFRIVDSLSIAGTMVPVTHLRLRRKNGEIRTYAFRFAGNTVTGDPTVTGNASISFTVTAAEPIFNFVTDIEWFRQLPLAAGRTFEAELFDPPNGSPEQCRFSVVGSDAVRGPDGRMIDCWLMTTDYNQPAKRPSRFWFARSNQALIREESDAGENGLLVKELLSTTDPAPRIRH